MNFAIGDTVNSKPVGSKAAFVGTIVTAFVNCKNQNIYNVRDGFNRRWQRDESELEAVN